MKSAIATMVITAAILALMAGSFAMAQMGSVNHANCLAAIPGNPECIGGMDPLRFAITHINALLGISLGVVSSLVLAFFASLTLPAWLAAPNILKLLSAALGHFRIFIEGNIRSVRKQRRWISLLEKRDPSSFRAMNA